MARLSLLISLLLFAIPQVGHARIDVVIFDNGDRLTGEVKSLARGRLRFKTDATGTIDIEWNDVARLTTDHDIQVETQSGLRYFGHLVEADEVNYIVVDTETGRAPLQRGHIVKMDPIERTTLARLDGDISAGYNFTQANEVRQLTTAVNLNYRTEKRILSLASSTIISDSAESEANTRQNLSLSWTGLWPDRWITSGDLTFERNDELGINLRTSLGFGGGRILRQTNNVMLALQGGLRASNENIIDQPEDLQSLEAFVLFNWDWFRYDAPELDWSTTIQLIPSLTESGRVRGEFDTRLRWEVIGDFFYDLTFYNSYDNRPSSPEASNNDYGIITGLSYDF